MPLIGQSQVVRSEWYDRNPLPIVISGTDNVVPHAQFIRATYTVPANRSAFIGILEINLWMQIQPSAGGQVFDAFTFNDIVNASNNILSLEFGGASLNDREVVTGHSNLYLRAADRVRFITFDGNTGGSIRHTYCFSATEFDA